MPSRRPQNRADSAAVSNAPSCASRCLPTAVFHSPSASSSTGGWPAYTTWSSCSRTSPTGMWVRRMSRRSRNVRTTVSVMVVPIQAHSAGPAMMLAIDDSLMMATSTPSRNTSTMLHGYTCCIIRTSRFCTPAGTSPRPVSHSTNRSVSRYSPGRKSVGTNTISATANIPDCSSVVTASTSVSWWTVPCSSIATMGKTLAITKSSRQVSTSGIIRARLRRDDLASSEPHTRHRARCPSLRCTRLCRVSHIGQAVRPWTSRITRITS